MTTYQEFVNIKASELTKDEFFSVALQFKPGLTREEYDKMWDDFLAHRKMKEMN